MDLTGQAQLVKGNEPFNVNHPKDSKSLLLSSGSSATSPNACITTEWPTLRFFARKNAGPVTATLAVEVCYVDALGESRSLQIGSVSATPEWAPTPSWPVAVNAPLLRGGGTEVSFRFTPSEGSAWQMDDVYVDPWRAN